MLQRQCYYEAAATFRDALQLMRDAAGQPTGYIQMDETRVDHLLHEASRRFAKVFSQDKAVEPNPSILPMVVSIVVLSDDFSSDLVRTAISEPSPIQQSVAIQIDHRREAECADHFFDIDSAVILFNYATATRCLGSPSNPMIAQAAYKSFHMAYGVLSKVQGSKSVEGDLQSIYVHLIAMLVVQHLAQSAKELQMPDKAQEHYSLLCSLRKMYKQMERIPQILNLAKNVAPAA